jgi:hypothetical protein
MTFQTIQSVCSWVWSGTKAILHAAEPYQPLIAAGLIVGKLGWNTYRYEPLRKEVSVLQGRLNTLKRFVKDHPDDPQTARVSDRIQQLEAEVIEKERRLDLIKLTLGQVPSLLFPHPGANVWNSAHSIVNRTVQMHYVAHPPSTRCRRIEAIAALAGGTLAVLGTAASLLRQVGAVDPGNPACSLLINLAMGVYAIEGVIMAKNWLFSARQQRT